MQKRQQSKITIAFFIFMAFVMGMGVIAPFLRQEATQTTTTTDPTVVPTATVPVAMTDFSGISFKQVYLHPSGLFTVGQPTGWLPLTPISDAGRAGVTMFNQNTLSIVEVSVEQPTTPITTVDQLDTRNDKTYLNASWARYGTWTETSRKHDGDQLVIDFNLTLNSQQYVARQLSWTDGQWIYNIRVVTPYNATDMLVYLVGQLAKAITPFKQFYGTPIEWTSYYDSVSHGIIRYPAGWKLADSAPGSPASITSADGAELRVETQANVTIPDDAAARKWVDGVQPGATILSSQPVTHGDESGFSVAYSFATVDGDPRSGVAMLLNGSNSTLYAANLRFAGNNVDVNALRQTAQAAAATPEATAAATAEATQAVVSADTQYAEVVDTFWILPAIELAPNPSNTTPTPVPVIQPTSPIVIPTFESTEAATSEATAAATSASAATSEATAAAPTTAPATAIPATKAPATATSVPAATSAVAATAEATP